MASDGVIAHYNAVRMRATGSGKLQTQMQSVDETHTQSLANISLLATTNKEPTILANFIDQRCSLYIFTTNIDEVFQISRITVFSAPLASQYPQ